MLATTLQANTRCQATNLDVLSDEIFHRLYEAAAEIERTDRLHVFRDNSVLETHAVIILHT